MVQVKNINTVGIIYNDYDGIFRTYPFKNKYTYEAYNKLSKICNEYSIKAVIAKPEWYSNKKLLFCWNLLTNKIEKNVNVDLIFDRCVSLSIKHYYFMRKLRKRISMQISMVNDPFIDGVCNDKFMTYKLFSDYCPRTFFSIAQIDKIKGELVIIKPRFGLCGKNIKVINKNSVKTLKRNYLLQEFIDTSYGIKGLFHNIHDLRLLILNGKIIDFYIRSPRKGLLSNISLGGRLFRIRRIPMKVRKIAKIIDKKFASYKPRFYSIDLLIDRAQVPRVVELNSCPTLDVYYQFKVQGKIYEEICKNIAKSIRSILVQS